MKRSPLFSIFLIVLVDVMGLTIIIPLLPFYAEKMGASPAGVGFLFASYAFCQLIAGPVLGNLSDRVGRRPVLLISQIGTFFGFILLAFSRTLFWVFAARVIDGLTAGNLSVAQAYIADVTDAKNRAKSFGLIGIAFGVGFLLGPAVSGFLAGYGYHYPILFAAFLSACSIAGTYFLLPATPPHEPSQEAKSFELPWKIVGESFGNKNLAPLLWQFFAFIFSFAIFIGGFALFAERRFLVDGQPFGVKEVGYVFAYVGLLAVIIQGGLIGRLVARFGEKKLVRAGFFCMVAGSVLLGFIQTVPLLLVAVTISFFGSSVLRPSLTSRITQRIGKEHQGVVLGVAQSLTSISQIIAPVLSGLLIGHRFLSVWAWTGALFSGIGLLLTQAES